MKTTYKVNVWAIKTLKPTADGKKRPKPYGVRWVTAGEEHSEWYKTIKLADSRRSELLQAAKRGEAFDIATGLPESEWPQREPRSLLKLAQEFIDEEWNESAPNTRKRYVDTLAVAVAAFVKRDGSVPDGRKLRRVLTTHLLPTNRRDRQLTDDEARTAEWVVSASRPVSDLAKKVEIGNVLRALGRNLNGTAAASWTTRTRRGVLHHLMEFAIDVEELDANPVTRSKVATHVGSSEVDPRVVLNPKQAPQVLAAVTYAGRREYLYGFFGAMYYAGLRPCEVNRIRKADLRLPDEGQVDEWGEIILEKSASRSNARYTDSGETWEERNLKRRAQGAVRRVPIPPQLVDILRWHLRTFGTTEDGRLFRGSVSGGPVNATVYTDAWDKARKIGLSPEQYDSPLAADPYDLRHAAVSTWLAAGVPAAEVAERAGHTVDVLLKVYAKCLDGQRALSNSKITSMLDPE
ncbi:tyrosine-type recombinase/integrase [Kutzneria kofuensis]|uniref:Integrase n=1 Tax=Kutzneria kofuensis TaxID=103725 RepID=A0A7W9KIF7_9PSEU|nr:tyrosine-type recombinase/integrase [Kutzneria kofuensis]MBB5893176.1 integrase [Kutzneria kofuensis]